MGVPFTLENECFYLSIYKTVSEPNQSARRSTTVCYRERESSYKEAEQGTSKDFCFSNAVFYSIKV